MTTINLAVEGEIATLTLNNPDKLNAINLAMWQQLSANMASISADLWHPLRRVARRWRPGLCRGR